MVKLMNREKILDNFFSLIALNRIQPCSKDRFSWQTSAMLISSLLLMLCLCTSQISFQQKSTFSSKTKFVVCIPSFMTLSLSLSVDFVETFWKKRKMFLGKKLQLSRIMTRKYFWIVHKYVVIQSKWQHN
jgi:hypothetical protein